MEPFIDGIDVVSLTDYNEFIDSGALSMQANLKRWDIDVTEL